MAASDDTTPNLAPVPLHHHYTSVTCEGSDTADLQEAKALLEALACNRCASQERMPVYYVSGTLCQSDLRPETSQGLEGMARVCGDISSGGPSMAQAATPRQDNTTTLSTVESDLLYEVVDGHIVQKEPMGAYEILVGSFLNTCLDGFARANNCGRAVSEMLFDFGAGLSQRRPDVAYVSYDRWPRQRRVPRTHAWAVVPELAVEVISPSNTFEEVVNKIHEYFRSGVQHVWVVAPPQQQVYVYQSPSNIRVLNVQDELIGDPFLPGFCLKVSELFDVEATEA